MKFGRTMNTFFNNEHFGETSVKKQRNIYETLTNVAKNLNLERGKKCNHARKTRQLRLRSATTEPQTPCRREKSSKRPAKRSGPAVSTLSDGGDVRERRLAKFRQDVARFRLYRHRSLQANTRFSAFFKSTRSSS